MTVMTWCAFFTMHGCLSCVYTALVIHISTIKHQHEAISQCNRFVSSPSRSPGGPITGPSGPWRWFREKRGRQKTRCDGKLLIHLLIKGHFLSAIRVWRLAYLGLDFCFIPPSQPSAPFRQSSSCGEKHQRSAEVDAKETLPHNCWCVTRMYMTSLWPCFWKYSYC